jgi:peptidoglycan/LPS O-acetylase OafA/YrhL
MGSGPATYRLNNFDLLRLVAVTQVCVCHALLWLNIPWPPIVNYLTDLFPGVPMFFVISGFLVTSSLESKPGDLGQYFKNRILRIYPGLWTCLILSVASVMIIRPEIFRQASWKEIVVWVSAHVSFMQFWNPGFLRGYGVGVLNGSLWTIPLELQFYLVLPVSYKAFGLYRQKRTGLLLAITVLLAALNWNMKLLEETAIGSQLWFKLYHQTFIPNMFMFMMGVVAKRNFQILYPLVAGRAFLWSLVYGSVSYVVYRMGILPSNPLTMTLLVPFILACAYTRPALSQTLLRGNDISYGAYLYNMVVINALREYGYVKEPLYLLVAVAMIYGLGALSWRYVEKPFLAFKSRAPRMTAEQLQRTTSPLARA